ncbi:alpha-1-macroglobulin [Calliopsis andreniformis]|uniref:alpha-1-macroglobulin n=1 Tax=Calliopsis andreniformis TaxID=337506 RepID=UPI003FCD8D13
MRGLFIMSKLVLLVLLVCSEPFLQLCDGKSIAQNTHRGYVFTIPQVLLADETADICVSLHNLEPPVNITLTLSCPFFTDTILITEPLAETSTVVETGIQTCLELVIPATLCMYAELQLKVIAEKNDYESVVTSQQIVIKHDTFMAFVETDKPVYKPGQDVNIRLLLLKYDLKPWKKTIPRIWIENPSRIRVAQWTNVSTEHGMAQLSFPLSAESTTGTWSIELEKNSMYPMLVHMTTFKVEKYVLPRFELTIDLPKFILADTNIISSTICAKYSYDKAVKGTLRLMVLNDSKVRSISSQNRRETSYEKEVNSLSGCVEFVFAASSLGLGNFTERPDTIILKAYFTEAKTGVVETTIRETKVVHQALKLQFSPYSSKYFKPGLPYYGKLRVLKPDGSPAPSEKIQICLIIEGECDIFKSDTDGFIDFVVRQVLQTTLQINATAIEYRKKLYSPAVAWKVLMYQPTAYFRVNKWNSPSNSYLTISKGQQPIVCGEKYTFNVTFTVPPNEDSEPINFYYSIISKGNFLTYNHVQFKPDYNTILNFSEFHKLLGPKSTDNISGIPIVHRFPLSINITPSMAAISELLLYYVRPDGEVVATTYKIEVGHCFANNVKTAWQPDVRVPGAGASYHVEAAPWSLCAISAVDKSILFLDTKKSNLVAADKIFHRLEEIHLELEEPPAVDCDSTRESTSFGDFIDTRQAFKDFGVIVISDLKLDAQNCMPTTKLPYVAEETSRTVFAGRSFALSQAAFPLMSVDYMSMMVNPPYFIPSLDQVTTTRTYFPETWLWELVLTGKEGKATIERALPHTITDWVTYTSCISPEHGFGIAPPTTITAFQPFFLDYTLPYSVKRRELLRLKVSLFNYMEYSLPVIIKLEDAPGLDLHSTQSSVSFCVKPRDSVVHEYILSPRVFGEVNITVSASIDSQYANYCGPQILVYTQDVIVKPILIIPEGFPVDVTNSTLMCSRSFDEYDSSTEWEIQLPENVVPGSGKAYINLIGNILGPVFENLNSLVRIPVGCGEQNMVLLVPNIHVIKYLDAAQIQNPALRAKAIKNIERGYQRELDYRHLDGSYSAFGMDLSRSGSIWLTAFVLKSFSQARNLIAIDENDLTMTAEWIVQKQFEDGCFPIIGTVFLKQMKGGLREDDSSLALTAYILIALLESKVPLAPSVVESGIKCMIRGIHKTTVNDAYYLVLFAYAMALHKDNTQSQIVMERLITYASRKKSLLWWEHKSNPSLSLSIEITAYAVLTLVKLGGEENMLRASEAVQWLSSQRNANGGFISTQDTVVGLEALTAYAAATNNNNTELFITVTAEEIRESHTIVSDNCTVLTQIPLPTLPTKVQIRVNGEGCVLVQSNVKYNVEHVASSEAFDLTVHSKSVPPVNECSMQEITMCARYLADEESNMALIEIGMISGYVPIRSSLIALLVDPLSKVKRFEEDHGVVTLYFDKLTNEKVCVSFQVEREVIVDRLKPENVKLYDYYNREFTILKSYSFPAVCSSAAD